MIFENVFSEKLVLSLPTQATFSKVSTFYVAIWANLQKQLLNVGRSISELSFRESDARGTFRILKTSFFNLKKSV